ncbi:MAG: VWA domain-containing protein [Dehalococcoidales bacterium]|nr:VWA domain-containing protein [Dehalococcoidales bacterium]
MDIERNTGIQISRQQGGKEISIVSGGIKIVASEKPISTSFVLRSGRVYILLDCSGSMRGKKLEQAKRGIIEFTRDALNKGYKVGMVKFSDKAQLICEPTTDIAVLQGKVDEFQASGGTNLAAAIKMAHEKLTGPESTKESGGSTRVLVVATDGMPDNIKSSLMAANKAKDDGIEIITIGTDDADKEFLKVLASRTELSTKVSSDNLAQAISDASLLLMSPKGIIPR